MLWVIGIVFFCIVWVICCVYLSGVFINVVVIDNVLCRRIFLIFSGYYSIVVVWFISWGWLNIRSWFNVWCWFYIWWRLWCWSIGLWIIGFWDFCCCSGMNIMLWVVGIIVFCIIWIVRRGYLSGIFIYCIIKDDISGLIVLLFISGNYRRIRWNSVLCWCSWIVISRCIGCRCIWIWRRWVVVFFVGKCIVKLINFSSCCGMF